MVWAYFLHRKGCNIVESVKNKKSKKSESINFNKIQESAPRYMDGKARYCYTRLARALNNSPLAQTNVLDKELLELLAINYSMLETAVKDLADNGQTYVTSSGLIKANPSAGIVDKATSKIKACLDGLGMSPSSRAKILGDLTKDNSDDDGQSLEQLLGGGNNEF